MRFPLPAAAALFLLLSTQAAAQTTFATITGAVMDSTGAVVPGVGITATNVETGIKTATVANQAGVYTIPQLKEGTYTLVAEAAGFAEFRVENIILAARDVRRVDIALTVGQIATQVEVSAGATLIETESARITSTQSATLLKTVPLNARWMWAFLDMAPNFVSGPEGRRFGGSRSNQANWAIDGTNFNDGDGNAIGPQANYIESYEEVKIDLANNSAEFGAVGQVTVITKRGTNQLHGTLFDYYSTPFFKARNPFQAQRPTGVLHLYGTTLSGPVYIPGVYNGKNRTFFFNSYEGNIGGVSVNELNSTVPLEPWRSGDFSGLGNRLVYDPASGLPFPDNKIPASRINPVTQKIQDRFYPLPNWGDPTVLGTNNYREIKTRSFDIQKHWVLRADHHISDKDMIYGRFTFTRAPNNVYEGNLPTIGQRTQRRDTRSATVSHTRTFNANLVNEFRWGMSWNVNPYQGPIMGLEQVRELGLQGLAPDLPDIGGMLKVNWSGIGLRALSQVDYSHGYRSHSQEFQNHLSWFRGRHTVKVGFDLVRYRNQDLKAPANLFGSVTFSDKYTRAGRTNQGHPYADFLLGIPTQSARAFMPPLTERSRWQYDFFVTDDLKLTPRLTMSLGLRYELHLPWRESGDRVSMFDIGTGGIVVPDGALSKVSPLFPSNYVNIMEASQAGFRNRTLVYPDRNNLSPRVSLAYRPFGNSDTVIRAGYGIFFDPVPPLPSMGGSPFNLSEPSYTNPETDYIILPRVFPAAGTPGSPSVGVGGAINPGIGLPYSMQYNFSIDRQMWNTGFTARYLGTNTRQGVWSYNYNSPVPDERLYVNKPRPFQQYPGISYVTNGAGHQYHAVSVEAKRHTSQGLFIHSHWTWARDIFDLNDGQSPENPFDRERERSVAAAIPTHRWVTNAIYQIPVGRGRHFMRSAPRWANLLAGGWEYSIHYTASTGRFFTVTGRYNDPVGIADTGGANRPLVTLRPDILVDPNLSSDQRSLGRWFDTGAFAAPPVGRFGTASKGLIKGPGINIFNMGVHKTFDLTERLGFRWEMTAVNVFNHPNWSAPNVNLSSGANFGTITGVGGSYEGTGPRAFRMGLRLEW